MAREKNKALGHHGIHMSRLLPPQLRKELTQDQHLVKNPKLASNYILV